MQSEDKFKKNCADLKRFSNHFILDDDAYEENITGNFKKCKSCNRPTINHVKPVHSKCKLEVVDDLDEIFDIEEKLISKQEFKEALAKLWGKAVNDELTEIKTTYLSDKFCKIKQRMA